MLEYIYASAATTSFSPADLLSLLTAARASNEKNDVTGVLLYHEGSFLQVLEGEASVVEATVRRIEKDRRHQNIVLLHRHQIEERSFAEWRMGFLAVSAASKTLLEGFSDFLSGGATGLQGNPAATRRVLDAFKDGRFHQSIR